MTALGEPAFDDLTARARIRDSAIQLFAERGIEATTIRDIAAAAGVSGGLVRHHFGSKDDLRAACDSYVLGQLMLLKEQAVTRGQLAGFTSSTQPALLVTLRYFARSTLDGSPAADSMFAEMVVLAQRWLADHHQSRLSDPGACAALLVAMEIGALVMREQLARALGADIFAPEGHLRLTRAKLEFYSKPLLSPEQAERAGAALDQLQPPRPASPRSARGRKR